LCGISRDILIGGVGAIKREYGGQQPPAEPQAAFLNVIQLFLFRFKLSTAAFFLLPCIIL
jgi:hypothetical protein